MALKVKSRYSRQNKTHASHEMWTCKRRLLDDYCPQCLSLMSLGATGPMLEGPRGLGGLQSHVGGSEASWWPEKSRLSTVSSSKNTRLSRNFDLQRTVD